jgi:hypothetical protein
MKIGGGFLSINKKQLFINIIYKYKRAFAFADSEMGLLDPAIEPRVVIHTVPHTPCQQNNLRLPKAMQVEATRHVKEKLSYGILEFSEGPYRSRYFLVAKKESGEWRFMCRLSIKLQFEILVCRLLSTSFRRTSPVILSHHQLTTTQGIIRSRST